MARASADRSCPRSFWDQFKITYALIVDQDDAEREYAYRVSPLGRLEAALAEAGQRGWTVVSMKDDWNRVFPD